MKTTSEEMVNVVRRPSRVLAGLGMGDCVTL